MGRVLLKLVGFLAVFAALSCGGEVSDEAVAEEPVEYRLVYSRDETPTPWPTFTPFPTDTPEPTLTPTAVPLFKPTAELPRVATPTPVLPPTVGPTVLAAVATIVASEPTPTPVVLPTLVGRVWGTDVFVKGHSLFPMQTSRLPESLIERNFEPLPESRKVIPKTARYVVWLVLFDVEDAPDGFRMEGVMRWLDLKYGPSVEPHVLFQKKWSVDRDRWAYMTGLGQELPGLWTRGKYRVELWDDRDQVLLSWDFEVK